MKYLKITVLTPKNQAPSCVNTMKDHILGFTKKVISQNVESHNRFSWIINTTTEKEYLKILKRAAKAEVLIKKFYSILFKVLDKANKLAKKGDRGILWIRNKIMKLLRKKGQDTKFIDSMSDKDLKEFIKVSDREEMKKLLNNDIVIIHEISEPDALNIDSNQ